MRKSTIILISVFALLLLCAALFLLGGTLSAEVSAVTAPADKYPRAFASIQQILRSDAAPQRFSDALPADAAACRLEDVTLTLTNHGLMDAEWVSVSVEPAPGDIAVYSITGEGDTIPARGRGTVNLKLIASASETGARTYRIEYYVYGMKRVITEAQDGDGQ